MHNHIENMSKSYISVLQSLSIRIEHLESKALAMKLGARTDKEHDAWVDFNNKMQIIKDEYYIETLNAAEQKLLDIRFENQYGGTYSEGDHTVLAILAFVRSEEEKRIVGHLLRDFEESM